MTREFPVVEDKPITHLGLTEAETRRYSLIRAIRGIAEKEQRAFSGFERECSEALAVRLGRPAGDPYRVIVPFDVLQRDLSVADNGGANLIESTNAGFIDLLRNRSVVFKLGVQRLPGLVGNTAIPKQSAGASGEWLPTETTQLNEQNPTITQVSLSPKTVGAYSEISRRLLLQSSPAADMIVQRDLAAACGLAVDAGVINGSGASGQPDGIIGHDGVGVVSGTDLGAVGLMEFQSDLLDSNVAMFSPGYITTPTVAGKLANRVRFANTASPLWDGNLQIGMVLGYQAMSTKQVPTDTMIFGDWSEVVVGEWGVLEIAVNPFADFKAGIVGVRALWTVDVAIRNASAFSVAENIS